MTVENKDEELREFTLARTRLLLDQPFYGSLSMNWRVIPTKEIPTISTNGPDLYYNPEYFKKLPFGQRLSQLAHQIMHCTLLHPFRFRGQEYDPQVQQACDYAINPMLLEAGFEPIPGWLVDERFKDMTAEQILAKLRSENPPQDSQSSSSGSSGKGKPEKGEGKGQGGEDGEEKDDEDKSGGASMNQCPTGTFTGALSQTDDTQWGHTEEDWQLAAENAATFAQAAGKLPGYLRKQLMKLNEPKIDYLSEVREFFAQVTPWDLTWSQPNRRFVSHGLYLPGWEKEGLDVLVIAIDMSGSTWSIQETFASEVMGAIQQVRPEKTVVIYWDTRVIEANEYGPDDDIVLEAKGGGGTAFQPVLDYLEEEGVSPKALICLTDLYIDQPEDPGYPVLWVVPEFSMSQSVPFGRAIPIPAGKETKKK